MNTARTIVFDNEAVQAMADPAHPKHRRVMAAVQAAAGRNLRRAGSVSLVVPTTVQVEAGWDRRRPRRAALNRLRVTRPRLDGQTADEAAEVVSAVGVTPAHAHLAVTLKSTAPPHAVLTSDASDIRPVADHVGARVTVVTI